MKVLDLYNMNTYIHAKKIPKPFKSVKFIQAVTTLEGMTEMFFSFLPSLFIALTCTSSALQRRQKLCLLCLDFVILSCLCDREPSQIALIYLSLQRC